MDLELLKRFYIVAQEGTLAKASERIHVVPSALTKSISDFEYQMKTQLFDRLPKGMKLTPQGERLFIFAKSICEQTDSFEKIFHEKENEISGELKIITTPFVGAEWLIPNLENFLKKFPDMNIKILLRGDNIDPTEGDVLICPLIPHQPHLIQKHLLAPKIKLFASDAYLKKFGRLKTVDDLNNHRLITYRGNYYTAYGSTNWILNVGIKEGQASRKSYLEIDSLTGMLNSALQSYGIAELPNLPTVLNSGLIEVLPELDGPCVELYYIFPEKRKNSKKINLLFEYLSRNE
jgi:DNA-binding transcriptional LysR family regulator